MRELNSMGFEPVELGDVGYAFKYESLNFIYMPDEDDEQFLRIAVPYMFDVTDENRIAVLEAMQSTSLLLKYAKVCIMQNSSVWAIYEHYMNATNDLSDLLENIIRVLEATALVFYKKINGEEIAEVVREFTFFRPKYRIDGLGWRVEGDVFDHDYWLTDANGDIITTVRKAWFTWGDTYEIDIADSVDPVIALSVVLIIDAVLANQNN